MDNQQTWADLRNITKSYPPHHPGVRLFTDEQAATIRAMYATGQYTQAELGRRFGSDRWTIGNLVHERTYRPDTTPHTTNTHLVRFAPFNPGMGERAAAAWAAADARWEERHAKPNQGWDA